MKHQPIDSINTPAAIIGAGLTGLTLAFYLKRKGIDCLLIEKEDRPGGVIHTFREQGFVYEGGPNTGVMGNREVGELFDHLEPDCKLEVADPSAKRRLIWKSGAWHSLPSGLWEAVKTPLFTPADKLRILGEPFRRRGKDPMESVARLVRRRLGESFLDYAVDPFISGIYAGDPEMLITKYALPKLYRLEQEYGSFIGGAIQKRLFSSSSHPKREVFSARGGLDTLVGALAASVGEGSFHYGASDLIVSSHKDHYQLSFSCQGRLVSIHAPVVVSTLGGHALPGVFPFLESSWADELVSLEYAPVVQVVLGFRRWKGMPLNAFGGLVPSRENRQVLGVLFPSSFLSGRAPAGGALLNVFLGGYKNPTCCRHPDGKLVEVVAAELKELMRLPVFAPDLVRVFRYWHAIPQYGSGSRERLRAIVSLQMRHPGLFLAGNIQEGVGMAERVAQARRIAGLIY